jgi:hypothetical protein
VERFKDKITLIENNRGCFILDTIKGCSGCNEKRPRGCYDDCYAKNITSRYKQIDFTIPVKRMFIENKSKYALFDFDDTRHIKEIIGKIEKINMPFVRIGEMGDPSEDWEHTINICKQISITNKYIVIITKHWKIINNKLLDKLKSNSNSNICINTSISALDTEREIEYRLKQYNRLKELCNSVLRIVTCDFNIKNKEGNVRNKIQNELLSIPNHIDTIFRPSNNNPLVINKIINVNNVKFLKKEVLASMHDKNAYLGFCNTCPDMCGIPIELKESYYKQTVENLKIANKKKGMSLIGQSLFIE